jgi:hypothetical protein
MSFDFNLNTFTEFFFSENPYVQPLIKGINIFIE